MSTITSRVRPFQTIIDPLARAIVRRALGSQTAVEAECLRLFHDEQQKKARRATEARRAKRSEPRRVAWADRKGPAQEDTRQGPAENGVGQPGTAGNVGSQTAGASRQRPEGAPVEAGSSGADDGGEGGR